MSDDFFGKAVIEKDEWSEQPLRHRFVHGQFEGTDTQHLPAPRAERGA